MEEREITCLNGDYFNLISIDKDYNLNFNTDYEDGGTVDVNFVVREVNPDTYDGVKSTLIMLIISIICLTI